MSESELSATSQPIASPLRMKRPPLLVVGMHRSGTSAITGALSRAGFFLGPESEVMGPIYYNLVGLYELYHVKEFNDAFLAAMGMSYNPAKMLPEDWIQFKGAAGEVQKGRELLDRMFGGHGLSVLKDPRISLLLPVYREILGELWEDAAAVICVRSPYDAANSIYRRDGGSLKSALGQWLQHTLCALRDSKGLRRRVVIYEDLLEDAVRAIKPVLDLFPEITLTREQEQEIRRFVRPELSHSAGVASEALAPELLTRTYMLCREMAKNPAACDSRAMDAEVDQLWDEMQTWWTLPPSDLVFASVFQLVWKAGDNVQSARERYDPAPRLQTVKIPFNAEANEMVELIPSTWPGLLTIKRAEIVDSANGVYPAELVPAPDVLVSQSSEGQSWRIMRSGIQGWLRSRGGMQTLRLSFICETSPEIMVGLQSETWLECFQLRQRVGELERMIKALVKR